MNKIVYLVEQPLDERNYERFGIQTLIDKGCNVEMWDFTPWIHPNTWQQFIKSGRKLKEFAGYFSITSKNQLQQHCREPENIKYFIDLTGEDYRSIWVKIFLIRMGATRVVCTTGTIPQPDGKKASLVAKLKRIFARGPVKTLHWLTNALVCKLVSPLSCPGLVVVSGEKEIPAAGSVRKVLKAHNLDYDIYLKLIKSKDVLTEDYAVFIDQDYCFHSDFVFEGRPFWVTPEKYFPAVCDCLRKLSQALKVDLKIAAHPRSSYQSGLSNYFEGIPVEYGKTAELLRDCKVVVCHDSTAIQFAVLFSKPLIFLTTDQLDSSFEGKSIAAFASELGKTVINLDRNLDKIDWKKELSIDSAKYAKYRKKYIKIDGSPERPFWEIVADHIQENLN